MTILLGIDPGSRHTGYGVIEQVGNRSRALAFGTISTSDTSSLGRGGTCSTTGTIVIISAARG